jgi:hypothetical protein
MLQLPGEIRVTRVDSSCCRQQLKIANGTDTIFLDCWNGYGNHLMPDKLIRSEIHYAYAGDYCPSYYDNPTYQVLPRFSYSSESGISWWTGQLDSINRLNQTSAETAREHITIIDRAIDSFNLAMELELKIRQEFASLITYRQSLNDTTGVVGNVAGNHFEMTLSAVWEAPLAQKDENDMWQMQEENRYLSFEIDVVITQQSTLDLLSYLIKYAVLRKE